MNKKLWRLLLVISSVVFIASVTVLAIKYFPNKGYKKHTDKPFSSQENVSSEEEILVDNPIDFIALRAQNPDVCGYIRIEGTVVDYPIMRSSEDEKEDFYLNHDWVKDPKFAGSIYMQKINASDFSDNCTVLYGHNMANGSMFAGIRKYRDPEFYNQNRYIDIYIPGHILKYEIFSAFTYDDRHIIKSFNFLNENDYNIFVEEAIHPKSMFSYNSTEELRPAFDEKMVVLSTCTDSYNDKRYLVVGKLIEDIKTK